MLIKLSDYIADFLFSNGVEHVFTVTGGGAMHLNDSFGNHPNIKCIYNHHEQACAIAAEGYNRLSNKIPVVCVTSGPGGTNSLTGVLGAYLDSIPMFIISGQVKRETTIYSTKLNLRQLGDQEFDITKCVNSMTKYSKIVLDENKISFYLEKALYICKEGRPGPVWIDIPLDIQGAFIETDNLIHFDLEKYNKEYITNSIDDSFIFDFFNKVFTSKRPVILAGSAIRISNSYDDFYNFIDKLKIPVLTSWNNHDLLEDSHYLYCGRPGTVGTRGGNFVIQNCDLLISLGCRMNIRQISYNYSDFAKDAYKIYIDIDNAELKKPTLKIDMPIHMDIRDFFNIVNKYNYTPNEKYHGKWLKKAREVNIKYSIPNLTTTNPNNNLLNPYNFMKYLFSNLTENDNIVTSNGSACVISFQVAIIKKNQRLFTNSGCASMGYGLPAAIGACIASKNNRTICIEGDGSIMMNLQELSTIAYNKLNIKIFILNNNGYHSIRQTQHNIFNSRYCGIDSNSGISFPNFKKLSDAFDIEYIKLENSSDINKDIYDCLNSNLPYIIEVMIDDSQFFEPKLSSKVHPDGTITSPSLDDMYPFLTKSEYEDTINYLKGE